MITGAALPHGNTIEIDCSSVVANATLGANTDFWSQALFTNDGTVTVFVAWAPIGATAPVAAAPASGVPANGIPILAGQTVAFTVGGGVQVSAITKTGTSTLYVTGCEGV